MATQPSKKRQHEEHGYQSSEVKERSHKKRRHSLEASRQGKDTQDQHPEGPDHTHRRVERDSRRPSKPVKTDDRTPTNGKGRSQPTSASNTRQSTPHDVAPTIGTSGPYQQPNNHRKSYRDNNPSTRIKSLRKQLSHVSASTMPAGMLAEKERELAFLLSTQQQTQQKKERGKNIEQYHFVRFIERKKAIRNLKRLRTEKHISKKHQSPPTDEQVTDAETDLLYTLYAPFMSKYVALFADSPSSHDKPKRKPHKADDGTVIKLAGPITTSSFESPFRTADWHTIHRIFTTPPARPNAPTITVPDIKHFAGGVAITHAQKDELEALRDGKAGSSTAASELAVREKKDGKREGKSQKQRAGGDNAAKEVRRLVVRDTVRPSSNGPAAHNEVDGDDDDDDDSSDDGYGGGGFFEK